MEFVKESQRQIFPGSDLNAKCGFLGNATIVFSSVNCCLPFVCPLNEDLLFSKQRWQRVACKEDKMFNKLHELTGTAHRNDRCFYHKSRYSTRAQRIESKHDSRVGKQHDFRTVLPTLGLNQPPSDL